MFCRNLCFKGIKLELDKSKLKLISKGPFQEADYYNHKIFIEVMEMTIDKELDYDYFMDWATLLSNCITFYPLYFNPEKMKLYNNISSRIKETLDIASYDRDILCKLKADISRYYKAYQVYEAFSEEFTEELILVYRPD